MALTLEGRLFSSFHFLGNKSAIPKVIGADRNKNVCIVKIDTGFNTHTALKKTTKSKDNFNIFLTSQYQYPPPYIKYLNTIS